MMDEMPTERSHQRKDFHGHPLGVDAGEFCGFRVAADGIDVAPKHGAGGKECHEQPDHHGNQHGHGIAGVVDQALGAAHHLSPAMQTASPSLFSTPGGMATLLALA